MEKNKIIIDGNNAILGRLSSYVAKQVIKGEEIMIVNCNKIIITGAIKNIKKEFSQKRSRVGSSQKGPKIHKDSIKIVKKTISNMLPKKRKEKLLKKVLCYSNCPEKFKKIKKITSNRKKTNKFLELKDLNGN